MLVHSGFRYWPRADADSHAARMDNLHAAFRQFCVDGANTARAYPERGREKIVRGDFKRAIVGGPGRILTIRPLEFASFLASAKLGALTVETFREAVANCRPWRERRGFRGWNSASVEQDIVTEMIACSPRGRTGVLALHPEGQDAAELEPPLSAPRVELLWIVAGDDLIESSHGSAGAGHGALLQRLREAAREQEWTLATVRLPGRRVLHSAAAVGQVLAHVASRRVASLLDAPP